MGAFYNLTPEQLAAIARYSGAASYDPNMGLTNIQSGSGVPEAPIDPGISGAFQMTPGGDASFAGQPEMAFQLPPETPRRIMAGERDAMNARALYGLDTPEDAARQAEGERYKAEIGEPTARNTILDQSAELTGIPSIARGGLDVAEGIQGGSPLQTLAGVGQAAMGAIPGASLLRQTKPLVQSLYSSPVRAGTFGGLMATPGALAASQASAQTARSDADLIAELKRKSPTEIRAIQQKLLAEGKIAKVDGVIGQDTAGAYISSVRQKEAEDAKIAKREEADRLQAQELARIEAMARGQNEAARIAAQAAADSAKKKADDENAAALAVAEKKRQSATPMRDLYPELMPAMPILSGIAGGALGSYIKGKYNAAHTSGLNDLKDRLLKAMKGPKPDPAKASEFQKLITAREKAGPGGFAPAATASAASGAEISMLPDEIDAYRGVAGAKDLAGIAGRGVIGAMFGAAPAITASKLRDAGSKAPPIDFTAEINSATRRLKEAEAAALARAASQKPRRSAPRPGTAATKAQSAQSPTSSGNPESVVVTPAPSRQSGGSGQTSSSPPEKAVADNTTAASKRKGAPLGAGKQPAASGMLSSELWSDPKVIALAHDVSVRTRDLTSIKATTFQRRINELGLTPNPITEQQARTIANHFMSLEEKTRRKAELSAARAAMKQGK